MARVFSWRLETNQMQTYPFSWERQVLPIDFYVIAAASQIAADAGDAGGRARFSRRNWLCMVRRIRHFARGLIV
jgi:hypothetical protein